MSYEEMLEFLDKVQDLEPGDLLTFIEQLKIELITNHEYVKELDNYNYDYSKSNQQIEELSTIIKRIKNKINANRIKNIIEGYNSLSEEHKSSFLVNVEKYIYSINKNDKKKIK